MLAESNSGRQDLTDFTEYFVNIVVVSVLLTLDQHHHEGKDGRRLGELTANPPRLLRRRQ
jgi:hypothetical protein